MSDMMAKCDWHDRTLSIVLPEDPERIAVRMFDSRHAPARLYVPEAENAKLRKLMTRMADALGIDSEWADPNWCKSNCVLQFGCWPEEERTDILCPAWAAMHELGVEVD